jgi:succinate-semialdehyde dehydrogenase/glutarate-semialdehyde dehydrogenase
MGVEDVKTAVKHASEAYKSWRKTSEYERAAILNKMFACVSLFALFLHQSELTAFLPPVSSPKTLRTLLKYAERKSSRGERRLTIFSHLQIITAENGKPLADARGEITYGGTSSPLPSSFLAALKFLPL